MIISQLVLTEWDKKSRSAQYAAIRQKLSHAYELPSEFFSESHQSHSFYAWQNGEKFKTRESFDFSLKEFGAEIIENSSGAEVYFNYKHSMGAPVRNYRHALRPVEAEDTAYFHSVLREKAFTLTEENPYGRIIYNGRLSDYDTGQWYYREAVINIFYVIGNFDKDLFTSREPDFVYEQTEILY